MSTVQQRNAKADFLKIVRAVAGIRSLFIRNSLSLHLAQIFWPPTAGHALVLGELDLYPLAARQNAIDNRLHFPLRSDADPKRLWHSSSAILWIDTLARPEQGGNP